MQKTIVANAAVCENSDDNTVDILARTMETLALECWPFGYSKRASNSVNAAEISERINFRA
jgi:hypothetical protein